MKSEKVFLFSSETKLQTINNQVITSELIATIKINITRILTCDLTPFSLQLIDANLTNKYLNMFKHLSVS